MSKRRRGYPSETSFKRGDRVVHGEQEWNEKLGRDDPCPCGSGLCFRRFRRNGGRYDGAPREHYFRQ